MENEVKTTKTSDENELKDQLLRMQNETIGQKHIDNMVNTEISKPFICPDFVLDFLQDKPVKFQKMLLTSKLSQSEKKEVEYIFQANEYELKINRAAIKFRIEALATKYPELQPYLNDEIVFLGTFGVGMYDRSEMLKTHIETNDKKSGVVTTGVI